jgi:nudix-type nucleoside diphosphatase (YffH/AdpP family)
MATRIRSTAVVYQDWLRITKAEMVDDTGIAFTREIEHHGDGVTVLPYDPGRRVALIVRLPRAPVLLRGEADHLIEAPAGLLEEGEQPEAAVRREALEEAGLTLGRLEPLGFLWTMPGISTERMHMFLGAYDEADRTAAGGGLAEEHENITVQEMPLAELARLADAQALTDIRTLTMLLHLRLRQPTLF